MGEGAVARVLHVDDDPAYAELLASRLEREGPFEVAVEVEAAAALERLAAEEFDCVVSDYDMPGVDGLELLRRVRKRYPDLPFILLTGKGSEAVASEAISAGVTDYFRKEGGSEQFRLLANRIETVVRRRRAEAALEHHERRHEEFVRLLSHDLRNPLAVVRGWLEMLYESGDEIYYEKANDALGRMEDIIDNLETMARAGDADATDERVELSAVATAAWEMAGANGADADLRVEFGPELHADASMLQQALENLFENAVTHGGDDVTVRVGVLEGGDGFYVEDDGPGIPPDEREQVFESGYSGDGGSGLGLAIVERIADAHGWEVRVADAETGGVRFEVTGVEMLDARVAEE